MSEEERTTEVSPSSAGSTLRAAREARGLTVDEVAGRLRLRPALVEALERDDLAALGVGPYGRGQLRNYARLMGIDEAVVVPAAPPPAARAGVASGRAGLRRPSLVRRPRSRWPLRLVTGIVLGFMALLAILWGYGGSGEPDSSPTEAPAGVSSDTTALSAPITVPVPPPAAPSPPPQSTPELPETAGTATAVPVVPPSTAEPDPAPAVATLELHFSGPCWVEVTDRDGARLLYRMAREGDRHELQGAAPFAVTLGNAREARITYNGAPVQKPDTERPVIRLMVGG